MAFCLLPKHRDKFKAGLKSGAINPAKLNAMTSKERRAFLADFVGEKAAPKVNALFESKLLLKNQKAGMISWVKTLIGTPKEVRRDLTSRIQKMDKVLDAKSQEAFLGDLARQKIGTEITFAEATKLTELTGKIEEAKSKDLTVKENRIEYGNRILELEEVVNEMAPTTKNLSANLLNLPRTIMSTLDLSAPLRQGWGMMSRKEFFGSFKQMLKFAVSEKHYQNMMADIITRPSYDTMKSSKLRITKLTDKLSQREEAFMSSLLDKIPLVRGSERAYTGFLNKLRADSFDSLVESAKLEGKDVSKGSKTVKDIASVVNDFTGSGGVGKFEGAVPLLNAMFFSPRKIAATVNILNPVKYAKLDPVARKAGLRQLFGSVAITSTIASLFALNGAEVETDPRSSDFGKVKLGKLRLDFTGGNGNYATLLARLFTGETKSTATGLEKDLGSGFGETSRGDLVVKWARNKLSPVASFIANWLYGKNAIGEPFELPKEVQERVTPMIVNDVIEIAKEDPNSAFLGAIFNVFGVGTQHFGLDVNWEHNPTDSLTEFKEQVGQKKFTEANDQFNAEYADAFKELSDTDDYNSKSDDDKAKAIANEKRKVKKKVLSDFGFKS